MLNISSKRVLRNIASAGLLVVACLTSSMNAHAAISYDPYADSVSDISSYGFTNTNGIVGAPDGNDVKYPSGTKYLTVDMGNGEEGTSNLRVYLSKVTANGNLTITFLDSSKKTISSVTHQLGHRYFNSIETFSYSFSTEKKAYRYVRVTIQMYANQKVDAVEATDYIGATATTDTDGDGVPDRTEQAKGTDPQMYNAPPSASPTPTPSGGTGGGIPAVKKGAKNPNDRQAANVQSDKDKDGMDDQWEIANSLNPKDPSDAKKDKDGDGLSNLLEFSIGSNPNSKDTDGDGMPDGWEYDHGLAVLEYDADADSDGDGVTNLQEYKNGTDPQKNDKISSTPTPAASTKKESSWWQTWFWIPVGVGFMGILGAVYAFAPKLLSASKPVVLPEQEVAEQPPVEAVAAEQPQPEPVVEQAPAPPAPPAPPPSPAAPPAAEQPPAEQPPEEQQVEAEEQAEQQTAAADLPIEQQQAALRQEFATQQDLMHQQYMKQLEQLPEEQHEALQLAYEQQKTTLMQQFALRQAALSARLK